MTTPGTETRSAPGCNVSQLGFQDENSSRPAGKQLLPISCPSLPMPPPSHMHSLNDLPIELLSRIVWSLKSTTVEVFGFSTPDPDGDYKRDVGRNLASCCLVCRRWLSIAQPLLFEQVELILSSQNDPILQRFHLTLTGSHHLAGYVRDLAVALCGGSGHKKATRMIGDCLELTTGLQKLAMGGPRWRFVTDDIVRKICRLSNLKSLFLFLQVANRPTGGFKPQLLLDLSKTLEELHLDAVGNDLLGLVPTICAKLRSPTTLQAELPESSPGFAENRTHGPGLRALVLGTPKYYSGKLLAGLSQSTPNLSSFNLGALSKSQITESDVAEFLSATPLLEHLGLVGLPQVPFESLPQLRQLRSLDVPIGESPTPDEDHFWRSLFKFISYCDHLDTLTLINHGVGPAMHLCLRDLLPRIIDGVIRSTTKGDDISTLTGFHMIDFDRLPIDTLEHFCRSAPLLQTLRIKLDLEHTSHAAASALGNLKNLFWFQIDKYGHPYSAVRYIGGDPIDFPAFFAKITLIEKNAMNWVLSNID